MPSGRSTSFRALAAEPARQNANGTYVIEATVAYVEYKHSRTDGRCYVALILGLLPVPDLGLWRPLGNNIIEMTSTPWPNKCNDCKDMCGIIMLQLTMSRNVAATQTVTTFCP